MTRLLLDENLSEAVIGRLEPMFPQSAHVRQQVGTGAADEQVWIHARENGFVLVTRDEDFVRWSSLYGAPPKVILVDLHNASNAEVVATLAAAADRIETFLADDEAALLVLGDGS